MPTITILGAGPMGLGAAYRLHQIGYPDWAIYEAADEVGGLSGSVVDDAGFTWDFGGHVLFTKHEFFHDLISVALRGEFSEIERHARIWTHGRWIPYPFQNNVHRLPKDIAVECIIGAMRAKQKSTAGGGCATPSSSAPANFAEWTVATFGEGIARELSRPFNEKVWCVPLEEMAYNWIGERVSVVDAERLVANAIYDRDDTDWGPNNRFIFPNQGATGAIWRGIAEYAGGHRIHLNKRAVSIDAKRRIVTFADGSQEAYEYLLSSLPLDELIPMIKDVPQALSTAASQLVSNSVELIGIGLEKPLEDHTTCWMYFADDDVPSYRVTNFAHYSAANVPGADTSRYSSYLCEVPHSPRKPLPTGDLIQHVVNGLIRCELISPADTDRIVSTWHTSLRKGYPIPTLTRDQALLVIQPWLDERGIFSRGRFGTWRYEIGNMDHAAQMGKEAADRIVFGEKEVVVGRM